MDRPLQAELRDNTLTLYAPNRFVLDWVRDKYLNSINRLLNDYCGTDTPELRFEIGSKPVSVVLPEPTASVSRQPISAPSAAPQRSWDSAPAVHPDINHRSNVNPKHCFDNFVEGKSNQLARAAARQVADNPVVPITHCFYTAVRVWVKRTCCTRWGTVLLPVSRTPKWCTCTPSGLCKIW